MQELTQEYLKECLDYDPEAGSFTWKERPLSHFIDSRSMNSFNAKHLNKSAGLITKRGYIYIRLKIDLETKIRVFAHRLAWIYIYGEHPKEIDHINGIKSDNRITNLRNGNRSDNQGNLKKCQSNNKTGVLGVCFDNGSKKYMAQLLLNREYILKKQFNTLGEAESAYLECKRKYHRFNTL